ncbi:MAG TPA: long-chain-fatty-acid--CoA ligase [Pyrinomonadaceae bacterium]|nr:long-chain-fatty-acid--CoA ligase [Pyrinomonadaceae bacterium]
MFSNSAMIFGGLNSAGDLLARNARNFPNDVGLVFGEKRLTWKELNARARGFANSLFAVGLEHGDRVAIYAKNSNQWVEALFGLAQVGLVSVTVNYRLTANEVAYIVENSGAKAIICDDSTKQNSIQVKEKVECLDHVINPQIFENLIENGQSQIPNPKSQIEEAMILYTSGTTGFPKGAVYSHYSLLVGMLVHVHAIASRQTHRVMLPSPLYSAAGIAGIYCAVYVGSQISLINYDVETACATIERDKITFTNLVPTTIQMLLASDVSKKYDLSSLEVLLYGGSPIPEPVLREAMQRFPKCGFRQTFATTETGCAGTVLEPSEHRLALENVEKKHLLQSCGRPQTNVDVKIVDEDWNFLPVNEVGEIAIRTEANMVGYWNNPDATAKTLRDGWLRTGDMARVDAEGYLYLVDRKNDMIVSGALNVYPSEVERILQEHESIFEVAVIGVPSEKWGEEVKAIVVLKDGANVTVADIIQFCEGKLAGFKKPKTVEFIDKLPRNLTGKILKKDLRERFGK